MRVLIDACLPVQLKRHLPFPHVKTAREMGWQHKTNGELLDLAQREFDVLVTMDQSIPSQQFLARFSIGLVIVRSRSNRLPDLLPLVPKIIPAVSQVRSGQAKVVEP
jgi:predicted nuclease of predicted toxin-antitoxin system